MVHKRGKFNWHSSLPLLSNICTRIHNEKRSNAHCATCVDTWHLAHTHTIERSSTQLRCSIVAHCMDKSHFSMHHLNHLICESLFVSARSFQLVLDSLLSARTSCTLQTKNRQNEGKRAKNFIALVLPSKIECEQMNMPNIPNERE